MGVTDADVHWHHAEARSTESVAHVATTTANLQANLGTAMLAALRNGLTEQQLQLPADGIYIEPFNGMRPGTAQVGSERHPEQLAGV